MNDRREMYQDALKEGLQRFEDEMIAFAKENPDVYLRGPGEFLTPRMTPASTLPMRQELETMDVEAFNHAIERIVDATSVEEAASLLNGGR